VTLSASWLRCLALSLSLSFSTSTAFADPEPAADVPTPIAPPPVAPPTVAPTTVAPTTVAPPPAPGVTPKRADPIGHTTPWYTGKYAHNRFAHLAITGVLELYIVSGFVFKDQPTPSACRWCNPPGFDRATRNALVWNDRSRADLYSTIGAYVVSPIVGLTLLIASDKNASATRLIDDVLPVAESVAIAQVFTIFGKWAFARERPDSHFADVAHPTTVNVDTYQSFWSGHSVTGFALTGAIGTVCHLRGYWTEPYVWAAGITLSLSIEYLRVAADKHYLSDVFVGGLVGLAAGLLVPQLMQRDIKIVPMTNGVSVVSSF